MTTTMPKKERLQKILGILAPQYQRGLPFLDFENPFQLLVATVLSAQCMDKTVNTVTPELFRRFPDPVSLAAAPLTELERILKPITYFRAKSHNLKALSRMIQERHGGEVPPSMEALTAMPGVGRKTAGVVLSVCFGQPAICVDTHLSRVSRRLKLTASEKPYTIEKDLAAITPLEQWTTVSDVLNLFGRVSCHARNPQCEGCPVRELCGGP